MYTFDLRNPHQIAMSDTELIAAAREWVADCLWQEDAEDIAEMSDAQILAGIERHYDGGLAEFKLNSEPTP